MLEQLIEETKQRNNEVLKKHFSYDKRGNIKEIVEGEKRTELTFGAINRLEEARVGDSRKLYKYLSLLACPNIFLQIIV